MGEPYATRVENGVVKIYKSDGALDRVICSGAIDAQIKGDEIIVKMRGDKKKIYSIRGFFKKNA